MLANFKQGDAVTGVNRAPAKNLNVATFMHLKADHRDSAVMVWRFRFDIVRSLFEHGGNIGAVVLI